MIIIKLLILAFTVLAILGVIILVRWLNAKVAALEAKEKQKEVHNSDNISSAESAEFDVVDE